MSYIEPNDFGTKMVDAGEKKLKMANRDTLIRAYMAGAILALAAAMAVTISLNTGSHFAGSLLFPIGFCILYLMGFDLLTGVFVLTPLAWLDGRTGATIPRILLHWGKVFIGNFAGALTTATLMVIVFTYGFTIEPGAIADKLASIGEARTIGYKESGAGGWLTIFIRGCLCNWMVSLGVVGAMISTTVTGKCLAMWMPIFLFFYMGFEHSVVNMFLFPIGLMLGGDFSIADYLLWNEAPTALGNMIGGISLTGLTIYTTHVRTAPENIM